MELCISSGGVETQQKICAREGERKWLKQTCLLSKFEADRQSEASATKDPRDVTSAKPPTRL